MVTQFLHCALLLRSFSTSKDLKLNSKDRVRGWNQWSNIIIKNIFMKSIDCEVNIDVSISIIYLT